MSEEALEEAIDIIEEFCPDVLDNLIDGLPDGLNFEWGYDEQLILDIAKAVSAWTKRTGKL